MITRLPRWVWSGAFVLAGIAGIVNVTSLLGLQETVTHLTGNTTQLSAAIAQADGHAVLHYLALIGAFVGGTVLSGLIIQDSTLRLGRRYSVALALESLLLCAAALLLGRKAGGGLYLAAAACGLQNAMVSTYSGAVIRTTHISGMFTDLGIALGHALRGLPVDRLRLTLCALVIGGFLAGGVLGALAFERWHYAALYLPAALTAAFAAAYALLWRSGRG